MAPRAFWRGYLKLSLVTCAVAMMPATSDNEKVRFHTLNRKTGNRIRARYVDAETGAPVGDDDAVKGYRRGENDYVLLEDAEIDAVALESTRTIDIETFIAKNSLEWIWYDKPHFLMPNDKVGEEAFAVIREAMQVSGMIGISRLVLYGRERPLMLEPRGRGIVLWTLHYGEAVRDPGPYFARLEPVEPDPELLAMVTKLIDERSKPWDPSMVRDPVQQRLLEIIENKNEGRRPAKAKPAPTPPGNVIDIMEALRRSLGNKPSSRRR